MNATEDEQRSLYLPDFCTSRATLAIVLIVELTAFVLTLARQSAAVDFWTDLVRTTLFLLWIGLAGAASWVEDFAKRPPEIVEHRFDAQRDE